jgi:hypothetical protein
MSYTFYGTPLKHIFNLFSLEEITQRLTISFIYVPSMKLEWTRNEAGVNGKDGWKECT